MQTTGKPEVFVTVERAVRRRWHDGGWADAAMPWLDLAIDDVSDQEIYALAELTPAEARALAAELLRLADDLDANPPPAPPPAPPDPVTGAP